jgi:hypothetical protein
MFKRQEQFRYAPCRQGDLLPKTPMIFEEIMRLLCCRLGVKVNLHLVALIFSVVIPTALMLRKSSD